ncbi:MAG: 4Fe-4S dicluster domain-containing protein [Candidatus Bathycorpusculaceae bacterium]
MSKATYAGVPRDKIPWYPIIDYDKCDLCEGNPKCKEFCAHMVFEVVEEQGKKKLIVEKPYNCVVFCTACEKVCPIPGAIKFPSKTEVSKAINKLREEMRKGR